MSDEFKTYRAREKGFDGVRVRKPGEVFTTNIPKGEWMEELDKDGKPIGRLDHTPSPAKGRSDAGAIDKLNKVVAEKDEVILEKDARIAELEKQLAAGALTSTGSNQQDPGPLDKSIPDLTTYLEGVSDIGAIDALIEAEKAGNSRVGALAALDARKTTLQTT
ncbi:hypothetical protein [Sphingopyxis macrogoltabida]|uniref:Uncharacterized protein n=1 Tax=Sphingopyxis macrogoltabida TaxID=33050 RepID=A0A0N9UBV2_SPHMC|nr:hypothetical protein [Sphingopyxis macrogoltabida]ALH82908.1 hypothetical protein AN936_21885 [Sphingopyxis macrogoltabida]